MVTVPAGITLIPGDETVAVKTTAWDWYAVAGVAVSEMLVGAVVMISDNVGADAGP